jgi:hypothetical protein
MQREIWKDIPGYEGMYQVSDQGRVKSLPRYYRRKELILRPGFNQIGHQIVSLFKNNVRKGYGIHSLMLLAFVGPPPEEGMVGMHLNDIPDDNRLENLRWGTTSENVRTGRLMLGNNPYGVKGRFTDQEVIEIRNLRAEGHTYDGIALLYNCSKDTIRGICVGRTYSHVRQPDHLEATGD